MLKHLLKGLFKQSIPVHTRQEYQLIDKKGKNIGSVYTNGTPLSRDTFTAASKMDLTIKKV